MKKIIGAAFNIIKGFCALIAVGLFWITATKKERKVCNFAFKKIGDSCSVEGQLEDILKNMDEMELVEKIYTTCYRFDMYDDEIQWMAKKISFFIYMIPGINA